MPRCRVVAAIAASPSASSTLARALGGGGQGGAGVAGRDDCELDRRRARGFDITVGKGDLHLGGQQPCPSQAVPGPVGQGDRDPGGGPAHVTLGEQDQRHTRVWWRAQLLSHTLAVYLCQQQALGSLRFADLIAS